MKIKKTKTIRPLISVIMPVQNKAEFLEEAIQSILSQTYTNWELICIDNLSNDGSFEILKRYQTIDQRIKVFSNRKKCNLGYSLNQGLRYSHGKFIARMDADDVSFPDRFEKQIELLNKNKDIVACGGQAEIIDAQGNLLAFKKFPTDSDVLYKMIMKVVPIQHPILMARANVYKKYRYDEKLTTAEDVDMLFYLLSKGDLSNVDSVVYKYRKTDTSNGYHNVKKTFHITFNSRFKAIKTYGYRPTFLSILSSLCQFAVVSILPSKLIVKLFEAFRFEPPVWKKPFTIRNTIHTIVPATSKNPM